LVIGTLASAICIFICFLRLPNRVPPLVMVVLPMQLWIMASAMWSHTLGATAINFVKCLLYANALDLSIERLTQRQVMQAVGLATLAILLASLGLCLSNPIFRISIGTEGWRGLFVQKNRLASFCLFTMVLIIANLRRDRMMFWPLLALDLAMLILSQGKTEIFLLLLYVALAGIMYAAVLGQQQIKPTLTMVTLVLASIFIGTCAITIFLIYDGQVDFTGRAFLWEWYLKDLGSEFLIGKGGITASADPLFVTRASSSGIPPTSDSSYIMIVYNNGIVGVGIFFYCAIRLFNAALGSRRKEFIWLISAVYCYICFAAMESDSRFMNYFSTFAILILYGVLRKEANVPAEDEAAPIP
jgi:hypothetical protein